jgi:hypothetical protein
MTYLYVILYGSSLVSIQSYQENGRSLRDDNKEKYLHVLCG